MSESYLTIDSYIIKEPLINILTELKSELTNGKLGYMCVKDDWIRVTCPNDDHDGGKESHPSCGIYIGEPTRKYRYGFFHCFTCNANGTFVLFINLCTGWSTGKTINWLISKYGISTKDASFKELYSIEDIKIDDRIIPNNIDESILDSFDNWHPYLSTRKLSEDICKKYNVKYDSKTDCIVFPVYDENGKLTMLTRRSVKGKRYIIDKNKEKPVYLLYQMIKDNVKDIIICESQINALTALSWGKPAVATFGCNVTSHQLDILNKSGIRHVSICYDGDDAGRKGTEKLIKGLNDCILVDVIVMDEGKDINDISLERFNQLPKVSGIDWIKSRRKGHKDESKQ